MWSVEMSNHNCTTVTTIPMSKGFTTENEQDDDEDAGCVACACRPEELHYARRIARLKAEALHLLDRERPTS
jgi:hypothetical protein